MNELGSGHCIAPTVSAVPQRASPVRLSEPHFDDQPRCNDAECSERSYDYAKDKLTGFAPSRLYRCVLKARILLRKPVLSLDTLFSRQVLSRFRSLKMGYLFEYSSAAKNPARVSRLLLQLLVRFSISKQLFAPRKTMADSPTDIDVVFRFKHQ